MTAGKTILKIESPKHLALVGQMYGMARILSTLDETAANMKLPGFGLASALVERDMAEMRSLVMHRNLVAVSDAGIDIATASKVSVDYRKGNLVIVVEFHDLLSAESNI